MPYIAISIVALAIISAVVVYLGRNKIRYMMQETKKENKLMFWTGLAVVAIAIIFFLTNLFCYTDALFTELFSNQSDE